MQKTVFRVTLSILLLLCGCGKLFLNIDENYPRTISPLPSDDLRKHKDEYRAQNNFWPCLVLNDCGFPEWPWCLNEKVLRVEITDVGKVHCMAKDFLLKNQKFTGVTDTSGLVFRESKGMRGCLRCDGSDGDVVFIKWKIILPNQVYRGLEVKDAYIVLCLDAEKVTQVGGNWYQDIHIPEQDRIEEALARRILVGLEIKWRGSFGQQYTFVVTEESIGPTTRKVILPLNRNQNIELRVAWEIPISDGLWNVYVDTTTGEKLHVDQLFDT